ncbi:hypothetical protein pb186bvf_020800 [Paramecium bursaria]
MKLLYKYYEKFNRKAFTSQFYINKFFTAYICHNETNLELKPHQFGSQNFFQQCFSNLKDMIYQQKHAKLKRVCQLNRLTENPHFKQQQVQIIYYYLNEGFIKLELFNFDFIIQIKLMNKNTKFCLQVGHEQVLVNSILQLKRQVQEVKECEERVKGLTNQTNAILQKISNNYNVKQKAVSGVRVKGHLLMLIKIVYLLISEYKFTLFQQLFIKLCRISQLEVQNNWIGSNSDFKITQDGMINSPQRKYLSLELRNIQTDSTLYSQYGKKFCCSWFSHLNILNEQCQQL